MKKQKYIALLIFILLGFTAKSQQDNTLYFLDRVPQSNLVNPAQIHECKMNFHGILMPVFGQVPPPISFTFTNNGFSIKDILKKGSFLTTDDFIIDQRDSLRIDFDKLIKSMAPVNYLTMDLQIDWLGAGFKVKDFYFTVGLSEKINLSLGYPRDLFGLAWKGNGAYKDDPADLSGIGLNFTHYREMAFGVAKKYNEKLTLGGRAKLLFGKSNINTKRSKILFYTDPETFDIRLVTDLEYNASLPDSMLLSYDNSDHNIDSLKVGFEMGQFDPFGYALNRRNFGLGLDFGGIYELNDKIKLYASLLDFGFIRWKSNTYSFTQKGDYTFAGVEATDFLNPNNDRDSLVNVMTDSLYRNFEVSHNQNAYYSFLPTKIYIGGTYKLNEYVTFGALTRTEIYQKSVHPSITLSATNRFYKWLNASISYSAQNRSFKNLGLGLGIQGGFVQFYIASDNIFGWTIREKSTGIPIPYGTRNMNIRFGLNLIFGCPKNFSRSYL